jgi:orotate phosphoribosyltransferase
MESSAVLSIFRETEALLGGHFQLTSGLHSNQYFQCAKVLQYPGHCETLCRVLAEDARPRNVDVVIAPALGGIVVGQEVGRQLAVRTLFAERKDGVMQLRRGFEIRPGERVLVCEDVITTGGSVGEVLSLTVEAGGTIAGISCIVDRSGGTVTFPAYRGHHTAVMTMHAVTYQPDQCPLCSQGVPVTKPGSRGNR